MNIKLWEIFMIDFAQRRCHTQPHNEKHITILFYS